MAKPVATSEHQRRVTWYNRLSTYEEWMAQADYASRIARLFVPIMFCIAAYLLYRALYVPNHPGWQRS